MHRPRSALFTQVNCIEWCEPQSGHQFLLTANDKTVKLWRVGVKQVKRATMDDVTRPGPGRLHVPTVVPGRTLVATTLRRQFQNAHSFHINSLSTSPDGSTFLSADDLNVHLWDIERPETAFNPINIQPENMNDLAEVITTAKFHPTQSATFCYGTSKGLIRLCDLRSRALCGQGGLVFGTSTSPRSFYQDIASVVSDMEYHPDGRHLITRDFMGMKTWDLAMPGAPIKSVDVHQHLTPHMPRLYDEDSLFDRFRCSISPTGSHAITGSYSNTFHVVDLATKADVAIEASRDLVGGKRRAKPRARNATDLPHLDRAIFQVGWHPTDPILTVATFTNVYLFAV